MDQRLPDYTPGNNLTTALNERCGAPLADALDEQWCNLSPVVRALAMKLAPCRSGSCLHAHLSEVTAHCMVDTLVAGSPRERRRYRRWSEEAKRAICFETRAPGVSVPQVAQRHSLNFTREIWGLWGLPLL